MFKANRTDIHTIADVIALYNLHNPDGYWFSPEAMRAWQSRLSSKVFTDYQGGAFFVSSEVMYPRHRGYTVRHISAQGDIYTFTTLGDIPTLRQALRQAERASEEAHELALARK